MAAEEVTDIVLTHCHFDHMGSVAEFPNAMIHHPEVRAAFLV